MLCPVHANIFKFSTVDVLKTYLKRTFSKLHGTPLSCRPAYIEMRRVLNCAYVYRVLHWIGPYFLSVQSKIVLTNLQKYLRFSSTRYCTIHKPSRHPSMQVKFGNTYCKSINCDCHCHKCDTLYPLFFLYLHTALSYTDLLKYLVFSSAHGPKRQTMHTVHMPLSPRLASIVCTCPENSFSLDDVWRNHVLWPMILAIFLAPCLEPFI